MPLPRARRALLALLAAALLAAAPPRAAAQVVCFDYEAVLKKAEQPGGCESATITRDMLMSGPNKANFVVTFQTSATGVVLPGPVPVANGFPIPISFTFLVGFDYKITARDPVTNLQCVGNVKIKPCKPECSALALTVNAGGVQDAACAVQVFPNPLIAATAFLKPTTFGGTSATDALVTIPNSDPPALGPRLAQLYPVGEWDVAVQVIYPNGPSEVSDTCRVTVTDATVVLPPVAAGSACFYTDRRGGRLNSGTIDIPVGGFAARPAGARCRDQRVHAVTCEPRLRGTSRRVCQPNDAVQASNTAPATPHFINLVLKNTRNVQPLTVKVETYDLNGGAGGGPAPGVPGIPAPAPPRATVSITFYKKLSKVPAADKATCVLVP